MFMFEETKLIKNAELWIFLIANDASDGMLGFSFIIFKAISFIASIVAENLLFDFFNASSETGSTVAWMYGSVLTIDLILNLFFPCIITVVFPSGIFKTLNIFATVPTPYIFSMPGSSLMFLWATTPINLLDLLASLISLIDLSLPAFIGITTPGKSTVFVRGSIGNTSGKLSFSSASSSSFVINGIKSDSSLISSNDILSILLKIMLI